MKPHKWLYLKIYHNEDSGTDTWKFLMTDAFWANRYNDLLRSNLRFQVLSSRGTILEDN